MRKEFWQKFDYWLLGTVLLLTIFGIVMIRSAIAGNIGLAGYDRRQIIFAFLSLIVIIGVSIIDYHYWASLVRVMYIVVVLFLLVLFVIGAVSFGSARWIETRFFAIQPSEIAKIVLILTLAKYFADTEKKPHDLRWVLQSIAITGGIAIWIILQPDLSTSIVLFVLWFTMIWISGLQIKYLITMGIFGLFGGIAAFPFLEAYQQERIFTFLFPDPNATYGNTYNIEQALITIGSGGWFGQGYGGSSQVQLHFLKVRHTDFIFSTVAAEFGFVGTVIIILLLVFVIFRCLHTAQRASDTFGSMIAYGFAILIFFQTAVNIGVNLNLLPVTGLTLPFVSYGGSSLLSLALGIGLVESVAARKKSLDI